MLVSILQMECLVLQNTTNTDGTVDRTTTNDYSMAKRVIAKSIPNINDRND
jgi:hypothetical protein